MIKKTLVFVFLFLALASYGQKTLSFKEFSILNDSLDDQISLFFTLFLDSYEKTYFEYPSNFNEFIEFYNSNYDENTFIKVENFIKENLQSFKVYTENGKIELLYNDTVFIEVQNTINSQYLSDDLSYHNVVRFYLNNKIIVYDEVRDSIFRKEVNEIVDKYIKLSKNNTLLNNQGSYSFDFDKKIVLLLQFEKNQEIIIHNYCKDLCQIYRNGYYNDLDELCKKYCNIYKCDKIIFSSFCIKPKMN